MGFIRNLPYYAVIAVLLYLAVIYAPLAYHDIVFKAYIKDLMSYPDKYSPVEIRALTLNESGKYGFVVDELFIKPEEKALTVRASWHKDVKHIISALNHRVNFKLDERIEYAE